jgi:hypothetical protein
LADPRFGEHLADVWDAYLLPEGLNNRFDPSLLTAWLAEAFNEKGWDEAVYELLIATGDMRENGAVVYMLKGREPLNPAELANVTTRYFLGVQLACAQCHDHPFTSYKQEEFWGVASLFSQVEMPGRGRAWSPSIHDNPAGSHHLASYEDRDLLRTPAVLGAGAADEPVAPGSNYREIYARWVASPENPYFAKAMSNRLWWQFFGRGLVDPVDDMHPDNPATHPEVLTLLAEQFTAGGFDVKHLCRAMLNTRAYQRTSRPLDENEHDAALCSHMAVKVLTPEQLYDSLGLLYGSPQLRSRGGDGIRARGDPRTEFVNFFARKADASPLSYDAGIPQLLRLMNSGEFVTRRVRGGAVWSNGPLTTLPSADKAEAAIDELYEHILSRRATDDERKLCLEHLKGAGELREIVWALLNSSEFCLNH